MESTTRFEELKAKGYKSLVGEERKEYKALLQQFGKKVSHIVTEQDLQENPELKEQGVNAGDTIEVDEEIVEPSKEEEKPLEKPQETTGKFVMTRNVLHDDCQFKEGQDIEASHKALPEFLKKGYAREKIIS